MMPSVRYLRMLTNAVAGGALMAMYVAVLVFQLNPQIPAVSMTALRWVGAVVAFYGPYLSVALYFLILGRDLLSTRPIRPAWLSIRLLAWLGAVTTVLTACLTWANLASFSVVLSASAAERMRAGAWATTIIAAVLVTIVALRYSFRRKRSRPVGAVLIVCLVLSVVAPMWLRGPGELPVRLPRVERTNGAGLGPGARPLRAPVLLAPRVRVFALDGASLGFIRQHVAAGQLPNFGRLLDRGSTMDLATLRPTQAEPIWAAAATGKSPEKNGVRSGALYQTSPDDVGAADILPDFCFASALVDQGFVSRTGLTSPALVARTLWDVLADYGVASGVAGWPLTYPAQAERGYVLSDHFDEAASSPLRLADASAGDPTTAVDVARQVFDRWQAAPARTVLPALPPGSTEPAGLSTARWDRAYNDTANELVQQFAPRLTAVRYEGLAVLGHWYLRDAQPELFGDPRRSNPQRSLLDQYYEYLDTEIGDAIRRLAPGDLLLVVSGFGMEPTSLTKQLLAQLLGRPNFTGTHESAPDGFLMAYGDNVAGGQLPRGSIADLAPTVLYYMGVEVGRDMDGFARRDLFATTYSLEHPVKYVASHDR